MCQCLCYTIHACVPVFLGYQVTGVEGELGEHLPLVLPLPLDQKPAVEWLVGLERAVSFSLASRLTDCLATLPCSLTGQPLTSEGGGDVLRWLQDHVEQNVLLTLDMHWSSRLLQVTPDSNHLQETWLDMHYVQNRVYTYINCQFPARDGSGEYSSATVEATEPRRRK